MQKVDRRIHGPLQQSIKLVSVRHAVLADGALCVSNNEALLVLVDDERGYVSLVLVDVLYVTCEGTPNLELISSNSVELQPLLRVLAGDGDAVITVGGIVGFIVIKHFHRSAHHAKPQSVGNDCHMVGF